jgi:putative ATP-dependent endonuclease of OLD family
LNRPEFHLCDRDTAPRAAAKYEAHLDRINLRANCRAHSTSKKEIENYLHRDAIRAAYGDVGIQLDIPQNFATFDDVPHAVACLVHTASGSPKQWNQLSQDEIAEKESKAEKMLCKRAARFMTLARLAEVDAEGDVQTWLADIRHRIAL